jgi:hypothetical protein
MFKLYNEVDANLLYHEVNAKPEMTFDRLYLYIILIVLLLGGAFMLFQELFPAS